MSTISRHSTLQSTGSGSRIPIRSGQHSGGSTASGPEYMKHAALETTLKFTPEEHRNVNERIKKTVDVVLANEYIVQGPGPKAYVLSAKLGVAFIAEIVVRPIQRTCSLTDPVLQEKIRAMAADPTHERFRHTYLNGRIWFYFRITDPVVARRPLAPGFFDL
ncbi:hypothetical protein F4861DRAFT_549459 [Xylaria intraflava]|nr:hypothetical protein F4861DRAFT_549459 [Xylaria intraflava]